MLLCASVVNYCYFNGNFQRRMFDFKHCYAPKGGEVWGGLFFCHIKKIRSCIDVPCHLRFSSLIINPVKISLSL